MSSEKTLPVKIEGQTVFFEVEPIYGYEETTTPGSVLEKAEDAFDRTREVVVNIAKGMVSAIKSLDQQVIPDEFAMEFAIKLSGEGNIVVSKVGAEANFKITMKYIHKKD